MIEIRNMTKSYSVEGGRHYVFRSVSACFPEGANIGIMGPNGGGKSTFLRILGGIDHPDSGSIRTNKTFSWPLGLRGGFVSHLTGRENCKMVSNLYGVHPRKIRAHLDQIKELSGIGNYFEEPFHTYSSGMAGRVGFALSMAFDFDYFLIDEITSVGDAAFKRQAKQALEDKASRSKVIMVSHNMADLHKFCDIGVVLLDGELKVYDNLDKAIRAYLPKQTTDVPDPEERQRVVEIEALGLGKIDIPGELTKLTESVASLLRSIEWQLEQPNPTIAGEDAEFYADLASVYLRLGDFPKASEWHLRAVQENRFLLRSHTALSNLSERTQNFTDDNSRVSAIEAIDIKHLGGRMARLRILFRQGDYDNALELLECIFEDHPKHATAWNFYAKALFLLGRLDEALQAQIKAIQHGEQRTQHAAEVPGFYLQLSQILAASGNISTSAQAAYKAYLDPKQDPSARFSDVHETLQMLDERISV